MKREFEYILLTLAVLAVLMIVVRREGISNNSDVSSSYKALLLDSFKLSDTTGYNGETYSKQAKNVPKSEMSSYAQITTNVAPNLIATPCDGNEPFPGMCSSLYATY